MPSINDYTTGINLLRGTKECKIGSGNAKFSYYENGFGSLRGNSAIKVEKDEQGFGVISDNGGYTQTTNLITASSVKGIKAGESYTLGFDYLITSLDATSQTLALIVVYNKTSTGITTNMLHSASVSTAGRETGKWNQEKLAITIPSTLGQDDSDAFLGVILYARNGNMYSKFRKVSLVKGVINHPIWSPSPFEIDYINDETTGINLLRGTRDFIIGNTYTFTSFGWDNGFRQLSSNGTYQYKKDNEGFTVANLSRTGATTPTATQLLSSVARSFKKGDIVTVSFEFMVDDESKWDLRNDIGGIRFVDKNNNSINGVGFSQTIFPIIANAESGIWYKCVTSATCAGIDETDYGVYCWVGINQNGSLNFRKLCLYKGRINNPIWSASPFDVAQQSNFAALENLVPDFLGVPLNIIPSGADLNSYREPGVYLMNNDTYISGIANKPAGLNISFIMRNSYGSQTNYGFQTLITRTGQIYERRIISGGFDTWVNTQAGGFVRTYEGGGTNANTLAGAKQNLGIAALETKVAALEEQIKALTS